MPNRVITASILQLKENRRNLIYLRSILAETWATYAFLLPKYGYITSNIIESLNGTWRYF